MPIHPLPKSSIASLTATQALTHPPSLIKELIENSIDANATLISVEITQNCLDVLQVKDNGHGILPGGDRECICRRGWTSKISGWEELENWGRDGKGTMGFRGEALAAAAEMAGGGVEVTTRVEAEKVGWVGNYNRAGELTSQSPKSVPIGTTVKVMGFLKNLPVRRETAVKSAVKHLQQIRRLLITYALSHPQIRFSFKVLPIGPKSKPSADDNWVYSPSKTVQEAAMKLFGKELTGAGVWVKKGGGNGDGLVEVQAFVLKAGLDPSSCNKWKAPPTGGNSFIFVDSRPISCVRTGPFKSLLSLYKNYLRSALTVDDETAPPTVVDPFIYLNIRCKTPGMYDPNIEPAKDDVLFRDWDNDVLAIIETLFKETYGELKAKEKVEKPKRPQGVDAVDFGILLARKPAPTQLEINAQALKEKTRDDDRRQPGVEEDDEFADSELDAYMGSTPPLEGVLEMTGSKGDVNLPKYPPPPSAASEAPNISPQRQRRPTWGFSMSANLIDDDEEDDAGVEYLPPPPTPPVERETSRKDISLSNPWVVAKMNSSVQNSSSPRLPAPPSPVLHRITGSSGGVPGSAVAGPSGSSGNRRDFSSLPGYPMICTNKNRAAMMGFSSPFAANVESAVIDKGQKPGGLDKWFATGSASSPLARIVPQQVGDGTSPTIDKAHAFGRNPAEQRAMQETSGGFVTATEFMNGIQQSTELSRASINQKFGGVDGPGGVIVRSEKRQRTAGRTREDGTLWPNPLVRHPFSQAVDEDSEESEEELRNAKRRRVDKGKGKAKMNASPPPPQGVGDVSDSDEQLYSLFIPSSSPSPPQSPPQPNKVATRLAGQKKFVPPLLKPCKDDIVAQGSSNTSTHPPLSTRSPHNNRQRAATAALGMAVDTVINALAGGDNQDGKIRPQASLSEVIPEQSEQHAQEVQPPTPPPTTERMKTRTKSRRLLPLERVSPEDRIHNIHITMQFPSSSSSAAESVERIAQRVVKLNLSEYHANLMGKEDGIRVGVELKGSWVGGVIGEWLMKKLIEGEADKGEELVWERELIARVSGWEESVEEAEGQDQLEGVDGSGGGNGIRKIAAVWV